MLTISIQNQFFVTRMFVEQGVVRERCVYGSSAYRGLKPFRSSPSPGRAEQRLLRDRRQMRAIFRAQPPSVQPTTMGHGLGVQVHEHPPVHVDVPVEPHGVVEARIRREVIRVVRAHTGRDVRQVRQRALVQQL